MGKLIFTFWVVLFFVGTLTIPHFLPELTFLDAIFGDSTGLSVSAKVQPYNYLYFTLCAVNIFLGTLYLSVYEKGDWFLIPRKKKNWLRIAHPDFQRLLTDEDKKAIELSHGERMFCLLAFAMSFIPIFPTPRIGTSILEQYCFLPPAVLLVILLYWMVIRYPRFNRRKIYIQQILKRHNQEYPTWQQHVLILTQGRTHIM